MHDDVRQAIAAEVRAALARHDKTQRDLATVLSLPQSSVWHRLRGTTGFRGEELAAIATWLGMPVQSLFPASVLTEAVA